MKFINEKNPVFIWLFVSVVVLAMIGAGYFMLQSNSKDNNAAVSQETSLKQPEEPAQVAKEDVPTGTIITSGDSEFGTILFDSKKQAIYIWELDKSTTSERYGDCAAAWPPVLTDGAPVASDGVNSQLLGTTRRTDGTTQVTYNDHPLYYYAHEAPGEVKCHNISTHGGLWWVIQPSGVRAE